MAKKLKTSASKNTRTNRSNTHSRKSEAPREKTRLKRRKSSRIPSDDRFETALKYLREGRSQKRAAEIGMVSTKRFRQFLREHKLAKRKGNRWIITDRRKRKVAGIFQGGEAAIEVRGFSPASLTMRHRAAVQQFLYSNDATLLAPFDGLTVIDTSKAKHILETRPNVLLRLANAGSDAAMKLYRLID